MVTTQNSRYRRVRLTSSSALPRLEVEVSISQVRHNGKNWTQYASLCVIITVGALGSSYMPMDHSVSELTAVACNCLIFAASLFCWLHKPLLVSHYICWK